MCTHPCISNCTGDGTQYGFGGERWRSGGTDKRGERGLGHECLDLGHSRVEGGLVDVGHEDESSAILGKQDARLEADAACGTRDDAVLAGEARRERRHCLSRRG